MSIYVIGHKNPDTDAICSAIAYAWFLRENGTKDAEAVCCGEISARTHFVLKTAGIDPPRLVMDVRPTVGQICQREIVSARPGDPVVDVYETMRSRGFQTIVVCDEQGAFLGLIPMMKLMQLLVPHGGPVDEARRIKTSVARIARVLKARFLHAHADDTEETLTLMVGAMSSASFTGHMRKYPADHLVVVAGDRPTVHAAAIDYGVRCLVLSGGFALDTKLLDRAREKGINVLVSPLDTASTTLLIRGSRIIGDAVESTFLSFKEGHLVGDALRAIRDTSQNLFPVVNDEGRLSGLFTKTDLLQAKPQKVILVDHNEMAQAVTGIEEADILEVIDHHRLGGGLVSREPIRFVNEPLGSTCTIVTKFLHHRNWVPPRPIGTCLAAGIIADTLRLTSPTTTPTDHTMLTWLGTTGGIDVRSLAEGFFAAGSVLQTQSPRAALTMDCKDYEESGWKFAVAQIEESGLELFWQKRDVLATTLADIVRERKLHFACVLVTDITRHRSYLLTAGDPRVDEVIDYPKEDAGLFELEGVVSRKKQLLPHLSRLLAKIPR